MNLKPLFFLCINLKLHQDIAILIRLIVLVMLFAPLFSLKKYFDFVSQRLGK
jgi:hypothetical protein